MISNINNDILESEIPLIIENYISTSNNNLYKDLEIFSDRDGNEEKSVFHKINYCNTLFGKYYLKNMIMNLKTEKEELIKQQLLLKNLMDNKNELHIIEKEIKDVSQFENDIFWLWKEHSKETKSYLDLVFFKGFILDFLNKNEFILKLYNLFQIVISPFMNIITPIICVIIPYLFFKLTSKLNINFSDYFKILNISAEGEKSILYAQYISAGLWLLYYIHSIYTSLTLSLNTNKIINIIHNRVNNISHCIRKIHFINEKYRHYFDCELIPKICSNLWSSVFDKKPSLFSNKGKILVTYRYLLNNKQLLKPYILLLGKVDSFLSIIKLYSNSETLKNSFCFPTYLENNTPNYNSKNVWHPYLDNEKAISNDFILGSENKNNSIITGPNAGGKSTFIKSIIISILLSQTIGISSCKNLSITPFFKLETYLNIPDVKGKESLFEAEVHRALSYINNISKLEKNKFSFIVMDEIFNSTNPEEGISGAYSICKKISSFKNNLSIITTHFSYLTKLEKETNHFINYKIPILKKKSNILYPYKIKMGISKQFIAIDLLKEKGFDKEIIKEARIICKKLKKNKSIF